MLPMKSRSTIRLTWSSGSYGKLLPNLPKNLVVFDGHCLWCQSRMQYVLERNFSFFHFRSILFEDPKAAVERRRQHALHFTSLDSSEGRELIHRFFASTPSAGKAPSSSSTSFFSSRLPLPEDLVVLLIEKVPSRQWNFFRQKGARPSRENNDDLLFSASGDLQKNKQKKTSKTGVQKKGSPYSSTASSTMAKDDVLSSQVDPHQIDLVLSVNFSALCRIGMHLDRFFPRIFFSFLYYLIPESLGSVFFRHFISKRRHLLWGTSEEDAVDVLGRMEGMKERRWAWRTTFKSREKKRS